MQHLVRFHRRVAVVSVIAATIVLWVGLLESGRSRGQTTASATPGTSASQTTLDLSPSQLNAIKIELVGTYLFPVEEETVGNISFADDLSVQVFPSYQGKIIRSLVELGEEVQKCQPLYTIDSPDLIQNESTLIGAAATLELTAKELDRARSL